MGNSLFVCCISFVQHPYPKKKVQKVKTTHCDVKEGYAPDYLLDKILVSCLLYQSSHLTLGKVASLYFDNTLICLYPPTLNQWISIQFRNEFWPAFTQQLFYRCLRRNERRRGDGERWDAVIFHCHAVSLHMEIRHQRDSRSYKELQSSSPECWPSAHNTKPLSLPPSLPPSHHCNLLSPWDKHCE